MILRDKHLQAVPRRALQLARGPRLPRFRGLLACAGLLVSLALAAPVLQSQALPAPNPQNSPAPSGPAAGENHPCARCHEKIVREYHQTAMAHASGPSLGNLIAGEFTHRPSGVRYKIYEEGGKAWLSFDRSGSNELQGRRELLYFIGSGHRGRTYVFADDGFFFESPVNWYGQKAVWDMTPAYQSAAHVPLNLPLSAECLSCHTSSSPEPAPGTDNKYTGGVITEEGIGCARCHGSGEAHSQGHGAILNPAKLPAARRDAICMQCHLEGSVAIRQPGRRLGDYQPGEDLQQYVHYYVLASSGSGLPAISQFEALAQSQCKQKSGDAMSCITCHDPHDTPAASAKAEYYRGKCIACHGGGFAAKHHAKEHNCVSCHMPAVDSSNVAHTQATDHRILRRPSTAVPSAAGQSAAAPPTLHRFPASNDPDNERDWALAWQSLAEEGLPGAARESETHLRRAIARWPDDAALLTALAFVEQKRGDVPQAKALYERALEKDALDSTAAADLGVIAAQAGDWRTAIELWSAAFVRQPARSAVGVNLAKAFCAAGKLDEARATLERVLDFNPDLPEARRLLTDLSVNAQKCNAR